MHLTASAWLSAEEDLARSLVADVSVPLGAAQAGVGIEKSRARLPDAPIVAAVAYVELGEDDARVFRRGAGRRAGHAVRQPEVERAMDETNEIERALDALAVDPAGDHGAAPSTAPRWRVSLRAAP